MQNPRADRRRGDVAAGLVVVGEPVLEDGGGPPVERVVAAQSPGVRDRDGGGQPGVLGVPLLAAPPQRVAQQIHGRGPDVEADAVVLGTLGADLVADGLADPAHQFTVPGGAEAHGLREHRGRAHPGHSVQGLLAGPERTEAEPVHRRCELVQHRDPLVEREPLKQVVDALGEGQLRVAERLRLFRHVRVPLERWEVFRFRWLARAHKEPRKIFRSASMLCGQPRACQGPVGDLHPRQPPNAPGNGSETGRRNLETDSCAAGTLHLTSLQHRSASTELRWGARRP